MSTPIVVKFDSLNLCSGNRNNNDDLPTLLFGIITKLKR